MGLPNILVDPHNPIVPEKIQNQANTQDLSQAFLPLLNSASTETKKQLEGFAKIRRMLSQGGAATNVAKGILEQIGAAEFNRTPSWL
jgi:lipid A disaccharide synthetase